MYTKEAKELLKRFSSGVTGCPKWDGEHLEQRMFNEPCKDIAKEMGEQEITEKVAREYILKHHNPITVKNGRRLNSNIEEIKNCMVLAGKKEKEARWVAVHGNTDVMSITQEEADFLRRELKRLIA